MTDREALRDKIAFVTGAAGGLGLAIARKLAEHGARVVLADIDTVKVEAAGAALASEGFDILALHLDVTDPQGWEAAAAATRKVFGEADILCNNAGIVGAYSRPLGVAPEALRTVFDVNVIGPLRGVQTFAPAMRARGRGHILNTGSITGFDTVAPVSDYSASKHAFISLSESMRDELAPDGIFVSVLCPGAIDTGLGAKRLGASAAPVADAGGLPSAASMVAKHGSVMLPEAVAHLAVAGMLRKDFYIFTHPEGRMRLQKRVDEMMEGFDRLDAVIAVG